MAVASVAVFCMVRVAGGIAVDFERVKLTGMGNATMNVSVVRMLGIRRMKLQSVCNHCQ